VNNGDRDYPVGAERRYPADTGYPPPDTRYPPSQRPYRIQSGYSPSRQHREAPSDYPSPNGSGQVRLQGPAELSTLLRSSGPLPVHPSGPLPVQSAQRHRIRRRRTWPQLLGGVLIASACVASAAWYVPRVMADDRGVISGTVSSSGVVALNFAGPGQIGKVNVHLDQAVRKGQVLAVEYAPNADSIVAADKAAIAAEQAKIAQLRAAATASPGNASVDNAELAAARAQLASDQAQLATDRLKVAATEIVAPSSGIVVAANGQPGQTVTSSGIRTYATDSQQGATVQGPQFSLLPEGPQPVRRGASAGTSLPVIALRVSATWQVVALIPEGSVAGIKTGQKVTITVPTAGIAGVPGQVGQVIPTPVSTAQGLFYQAVITVTGHAANVPVNGMAADVKLG
jgi:multidrug resistance efflux pump